jgi:hypothetical protein
VTALAWALVAVQVVTTVVCAVGLFHANGIVGARIPLRRAAVALAVSGLLPVPVLLSATVPAGAWGVWGATTIAAALVYGLADAERDIPSSPGRAGDG